jgi:hypothetical protein
LKASDKGLKLARGALIVSLHYRYLLLEILISIRQLANFSQSVL